jgi:quercetin dioxygenase-like cupin family protein
MSTDESIVVRRAADAMAQSDRTAWGSLTWLASSALAGCPNLTVGRVVIKRGEDNPRHAHANCQEILHLLAGELDHEVGGQWVRLSPGDTLVVDAGVPHHARSVGECDADMIVVYDAGQRQFAPVA